MPFMIEVRYFQVGKGRARRSARAVMCQLGVWPRWRRARRARTGNIADTLNRQHPLHFLGPLDWSPMVGCAQPTWVSIVQLAQEHVIKVNGPDAAPLSFQSDQVSGKGFTDKTEASLPLDLAAIVNSAKGQWPGIARRTTAAIRAAAVVIVTGWRLLIQGFVRPLMIIMMQPACGPCRLKRWVACGRARGLGLEHAMPLFMRTIVLGMSSSGKLHFNAQGDEPGTQAGQAHGSRRTKRTAVVHAQGPGLSPLFKEAYKSLFYRHKLLARQHPGQQAKAANQVADGQRIHAFSVRRGEPTLEVNRPNIVGPAGGAGSMRTHHRPRQTPAPRNQQAQAAETGTDGTAGRQPGAGMFLPQGGAKFFWSPTRVLPPQVFDALNPQLRQSMGAVARRTGAVLQRSRTTAAITAQPLVTRLPADVPNAAELAHRDAGRRDGENKSELLLQRKGINRWHKATDYVSDVAGLKCQRCCRFVPSDAPYLPLTIPPIITETLV